MISIHRRVRAACGVQRTRMFFKRKKIKKHEYVLHFDTIITLLYIIILRTTSQRVLYVDGLFIAKAV